MLDTRTRILEHLERGPASSKVIAEKVGIPHADCLDHIRGLHEHRLVELAGNKGWRLKEQKEVGHPCG